MYRLPPLVKNSDNKTRKVGFEVEFSGIEIRKAAGIIKNIYGGKLKEKNRYYLKLVESEPGEFTIKMDSSFLYDKKYSKTLKKLGIDNIESFEEENLYERLEEFFENIASGFIPYEIVTPPVSLDNISVFDKLIKKLRHEKAEGTGSSPVYAFATHINPEAPSLEASSILSYLRSFLLLYEWLYKELHIDFTRKMTTFIHPFTSEYAFKVLNNKYNPDLETFTDDYIRHNPERNRPLDLYPLLSYIKPEVKKKEKTGIVKSRPTYHYRLPNSEINRKYWNFSNDWNYWWYVEKLAYEKPAITELSEQYMEIHSKLLTNSRNRWIEKTTEWIKSIST